MKLFHYALTATLVIAAVACNSNTNTTPSTTATAGDTTKPKTVAIKADTISYADGATKLIGYVAFDSASTAKRPVVLVVPEWWGIGDYVKSRAKQLAELGYLAIAVDMYGNGTQAPDPEAAGKLAMPFYKDPQMAKKRFDAALATIKTYPQADTTKIAAIGYCFGGAMVLNAAKLGDNLAGVVSFHGNLAGVPADKALLKAKILICHGAADQFVSKEEVAGFRKQMDSIGAVYTFKSYANATHAFTNPDATEVGKKFKMPIEYNEAADKASWADMNTFFANIFK